MGYDMRQVCGAKGTGVEVNPTSSASVTHAQAAGLLVSELALAFAPAPLLAALVNPLLLLSPALLLLSPALYASSAPPPSFPFLRVSIHLSLLSFIGGGEQKSNLPPPRKLASWNMLRDDGEDHCDDDDDDDDDRKC